MHYFNNIQHKKLKININNDVLDKLDKRHKKLINKLKEYSIFSDDWNPEYYWTQYVKKIKNNVIFIKTRIDYKKIILSFNVTDNNILKENIGIWSKKFFQDIKPYIEKTFFILILKFYFENYQYFLNNEELISIWHNEIFIKNKLWENINLQEKTIARWEIYLRKEGYKFVFPELIFIDKKIKTENWFLLSEFYNISFYYYCTKFIEYSQLSIQHVKDMFGYINNISNIQKNVLIGFCCLVDRYITLQSTDKKFKEELKQFAICNIGYPQIKDKWFTSNRRFRDIIEKSRKTILKWYSEEAIYSFFSELDFEPKRKNFWINKIDSFVDCKLCIPKTHLKKNNKLESLYKKCPDFFVVGETGNQSCIVLNTGKNFLIEYDISTSLRIHNLRDKQIQNFFKKTTTHNTLEMKNKPCYNRIVHTSNGNWMQKTNNVIRRGFK